MLMHVKAERAWLAITNELATDRKNGFLPTLSANRPMRKGVTAGITYITLSAAPALVVLYPHFV